MPSADCFTFSESEGLLEPAVDLGAPVREGDVIARIHPIDRLGAEPRDYRAKLGGILVARHFPGLVGIGDSVAVVAVAS
jgi:N-alpha-acetyl-L-2,4-diaminobutyrate deacetylase